MNARVRIPKRQITGVIERLAVHPDDVVNSGNNSDGSDSFNDANFNDIENDKVEYVSDSTLGTIE